MARIIRNFSPLSLLALAACGSGGSGSGSASGHVVKGPLENALVFVDANENGLFDDGETSTRTDSDGAYEISNPNSFSILVTTDSSTIDTSSGQVLDGLTLTASSDGGLVTPLTGISLDTADSQALAAALGLPSDTDFTTFNPYAEGVDAAVALAYEQVSQTIVSTAQIVGGALEANGDAASGEGLQTAFEAVIEAVAANAEAGETTFDPATLAQTVIAETSSLTAEQQTALADQVVTVSEAIDQVESLDAEDAADTFASAAVIAESYEEDLDSGLSVDAEAVVANAAPTDIVLSKSSVDENASSAVIGSIAFEDDGDLEQSFSYELSGDDASAFDVQRTSLVVADGVSLNFEEQSSYSVDITVTDEGGRSFTKSFTITVNGVDEETVQSKEPLADESEFSHVGDTLTVDDGDALYAHFADPDNEIDGNSENSFASHSFQWMRDGEAIDGATSNSYTLTEDDAAADISLVITLVDQQGGESESEVAFGPVFAEEALVEISVGNDFEEFIETTVVAEAEAAESLLTDFGDTLAERMQGFSSAIDAFFDDAGDVDIEAEIEVGDGSISIRWDGYAQLKLEFGDLSFDDLDDLESFIENFDVFDSSTWPEGGFDSLRFYEDGEQSFSVSYHPENNGDLDDIRITIRDVNDGSIDTVGITGSLPDTFSAVLNAIVDIEEAWDDANEAFDAAHAAEDDAYNLYFGGTITLAEFESRLDEVEAMYEAAYELDDAAAIDSAQIVLETIAPNGFIANVAGESGHYINLDLFAEDEATLTVGDVRLSVEGELGTGDYPSDTTELFALLEALPTLTDPEESIETLLSELEELGFSGVTNITLSQNVAEEGEGHDYVTMLNIAINDFDGLVAAADDIEVDDHFMGETEDSDGETVAYAYDDEGLYVVTGESEEVVESFISLVSDSADLDVFTGDAVA